MALMHKEIDGSDGEYQSVAAANKSGGALSVMDVSSDGPDLKSPESNDSVKLLSGVSKIKFELLEAGVSTQCENSNDGALSEPEQQPGVKVVKAEEHETAGTASGSGGTHDDLIKTTVKRKEAKEKCGKRKDSKAGTGSGLNSLHFRPMISEEAMQKIREGWTVQNVGDLTIGDLYIMFGEENKLYLEYFWEMPKEEKSEVVAAAEAMEVVDGPVDAAVLQVNGSCGDVPKSYNVYETNLSGRLKQLLQIANLNDKTGKRRCPCGHVCDRKNKNIDTMTSASTLNDSLLFKQPLLPTRANAGATLANCNVPHMRYKQSRWWRMRVNRQQLPSQRLLLPNGSASPYLPPMVGSAGRTNNNIYAPSPSNSKMVTNGGTTLPTSTVSSSVGQLSKAKTSSGSSAANTEDHLTKLLEDKINRISSNSGSKSSTMPVVETTSDGVNDDSLSLFDISLPSTSSTLIADLMANGSSSVSGLVSEDTSASNCTNLSATQILRESPVDGKLIETDINDISLSSFLGHLDAVYESQTPASRRRESDQMNISIISESSVDYIARFEDIAAELRAQQQEQDSSS